MWKICLVKHAMQSSTPKYSKAAGAQLMVIFYWSYFGHNLISPYSVVVVVVQEKNTQ
jgi:hypothetical protein